MAQKGVERNQELKDSQIYADTRSFDQKLGDTLFQYQNMRNLLFFSALICIALPVIIPLALPTLFMFYGWWQWRRKVFKLPIRYPEWSKLRDPSEATPGTIARGIEFIGVEKRGRTILNTYELWASSDDVRTHRVIFGTTGAGKTQALLSILFNPLCWGSGFSMTDGKAQTDVTANIFVMSWIFWREDDVLILNYMRGGQDRFKEMVNRPRIGDRKNRLSNTWNPFSTANHETINQIIDSIMEKASGDGAQWQAKAINMKNAVVQTIAYLRAKGEMLMSVSAIREQMILDNIIKLAKRTDIPPAAAAAIRSYLSSGLPGFQWARVTQNKPQEAETLIQHGYLTGQFTRTLGLMIDTYYDIFGDEIPEYDTSDIVLNNRISFTMIPSLEKGVEEAGNLGKMQVASVKMIMSENLGYNIEGAYEDVVENRPTNSHRPYYIAFDELGYYFAPGMDLIFAQGRSLQIALIAAGQDFQAMAKNHKNEVESMIANTSLKHAMKLEDPTATFDIFDKAAGAGSVSRLTGFEQTEPSPTGDIGFKKNQTVNIEKTSRISLQELKDLQPGHGVMIHGSKVIRYEGFNLFMKYKFDKKQVNIRINTFVPISAPDGFQVIAHLCKPVRNTTDVIHSRIRSIIRSGKIIVWPSDIVKKMNEDNLVVGFSKAVELGLMSSNGVSYKPMPFFNRQIVLYRAGVNALKGDVSIIQEIELYKEKIAESVAANPIKKNLANPDFDSDFGLDDEEKTKEYINNPPFEIKPTANEGSRSVSDLDFNEGEDIEFGGHQLDASFNEDIDEIEQNEIINRELIKQEVKLNNETTNILSETIQSLSGGPFAVGAAFVEQEVETIETTIQESCKFKEAGIGVDTPPEALKDIIQLKEHMSSFFSK